MSASGGQAAPRVITSPANARVKWLHGLRRRRSRDLERVTLVEGYDELTLALDAGVLPRELFHCPELVRDEGRLSLVDRVRALGGDVTVLGAAAFARATYRESPDGWIAVVPDPSRPLSELVLPAARPALVLVCEAIEKPGNLGAMLRTAEAAGVDAVIAASPVADWGNPNVVRASKGTVFAVPVSTASTADVVAWLAEHRLSVVVATPSTDALVTDIDLTGPTAIVVGAEHEGISRPWLEAADHTAKLAMHGHVNSLNVATSAAVVIYEALRQRA